MASDLPLILSGSALALGLVGSALASGLETGFYVLDPVQLRHPHSVVTPPPAAWNKSDDTLVDCWPSCCCSPTA